MAIREIERQAWFDTKECRPIVESLRLSLIKATESATTTATATDSFDLSWSPQRLRQTTALRDIHTSNTTSNGTNSRSHNRFSMACGHCTYLDDRESWSLRFRPYGLPVSFDSITVTSPSGGILGVGLQRQRRHPHRNTNVRTAVHPSIFVASLVKKHSPDSQNFHDPHPEQPPQELIQFPLKCAELCNMLMQASHQLQSLTHELSQDQYSHHTVPIGPICCISRNDFSEINVEPLLRTFWRVHQRSREMSQKEGMVNMLKIAARCATPSLMVPTFIRGGGYHEWGIETKNLNGELVVDGTDTALRRAVVELVYACLDWSPYGEKNINQLMLTSPSPKNIALHLGESPELDSEACEVEPTSVIGDFSSDDDGRACVKAELPKVHKNDTVDSINSASDVKSRKNELKPIKSYDIGKRRGRSSDRSTMESRKSERRANSVEPKKKERCNTKHHFKVENRKCDRRNKAVKANCKRAPDSIGTRKSVRHADSVQLKREKPFKSKHLPKKMEEPDDGQIVQLFASEFKVECNANQFGRSKRKIKSVLRFDPTALTMEQKKLQDAAAGATGIGFPCPHCAALCLYSEKECSNCQLQCRYIPGTGVVIERDRRDIGGAGHMSRLVRKETETNKDVANALLSKARKHNEKRGILIGKGVRMTTSLPLLRNQGKSMSNNGVNRKSTKSAKDKATSEDANSTIVAASEAIREGTKREFSKKRKVEQKDFKKRKVKKRVSQTQEITAVAKEDKTPQQIIEKSTSQQISGGRFKLYHATQVLNYSAAGNSTSVDFGGTARSAYEAVEKRMFELESQDDSQINVDDEYTLEMKLYVRGVKDRQRKADAERLEKMKHKEECDQRLMEWKYANRSRRASPQETELSEFLSRSLHFASSKRSSSRIEQCNFGRECELCITEKGSEGKIEFDLPIPSYRQLPSVETWIDDGQVPTNVRPSRKSNKGKKIVEKLKELKHTLKFIAAFNDGYLKHESRRGYGS